LHLPRLHAHPATYASRLVAGYEIQRDDGWQCDVKRFVRSWILTLFTDCKMLPHRMVLPFLDLFFDAGWKAFYQVCLAILSTLEVRQLSLVCVDLLARTYALSFDSCSRH